jgi:hydrogenase expression/formation protein HypC
MCLAIPGEVIRWMDRDPLLASAVVRFGELERVCHLACVPEVNVGEYVIVHAGVAISKVNATEAQKLFNDLDQIEVVEELRQTSTVCRGAT